LSALSEDEKQPKQVGKMQGIWKNST